MGIKESKKPPFDLMHFPDMTGTGKVYRTLVKGTPLTMGSEDNYLEAIGTKTVLRAPLC